jgi:hypothetical protein
MIFSEIRKATLMVLKSDTWKAAAKKDLDRLEIACLQRIQVGKHVEVGEIVRVRVYELEKIAKLVHAMKRHPVHPGPPFVPFKGYITIGRRPANNITCVT